jgi:tetratricopeptide (TPR) repeat protein
MGAVAGTRDADLERAQKLLERAFASDNPATRIALAHDALAISENCADAYVLLAEEEADTVQRALELYQQGVAAGDRALGDQFEEYVGHFWGVLETRPYMRARLGLANMLNRMNRRDEALAHYREMLRLNPNDNQGVRDIVLDLLLQLQRDEHARELIEQYQDNWTAVWLYSRALLLFRKDGASAHANKALAAALEENPFAPDYLTGRKRIPNRLPGLIGWGEESEAIAYAADHLNHWRVTPGAVEWLAEQSQTRRKPARRATARRSRR